MNYFEMFLTVCVINFFFAVSAYAYIDPNTGGFFFQTIAPFIYGILGAIVIFWKRIVGFVKSIISRKKDVEDSTKDAR